MKTDCDFLKVLHRAGQRAARKSDGGSGAAQPAMRRAQAKHP
jgi:hypothetical protein